MPLQEAWPILIACGVLLLCQGTLLFLDARKRGGKAWFWGLWGLIQFPMPTITYALLLWWKKRKRK
ncbi:hypothetical protein E5161_20270 [Cohnella pontilimi]|uniref:SigmaY antisigma factor component n=1 Tax=Cohnella pontilimi TaxID=2564100 RepID=A0A4U0F251_9BACL|nr:hypothetical protein [Cohnella pontilimi]TJY38537.1 hypothetical protein E5161_20270 [Cohnella pontilimi]